MKPRVIAADDNPAFLTAVVSALERDFDVIGTATDGRTALTLIRDSQPEIAILDIAMPSLNGIEVTRQVINSALRTAIVICSVETNRSLIEAAHQAGALGYVFKMRVAQDLILAAKAAHRGQSFTSSSL